MKRMNVGTIGRMGKAAMAMLAAAQAGFAGAVDPVRFGNQISALEHKRPEFFTPMGVQFAQWKRNGRPVSGAAAAKRGAKKRANIRKHNKTAHK